MTKYERFKDEFLCWLNKFFPNDYAYVRSLGVAGQYDIPENHVEEMLLQWAEEGLVALAAWDGMRLRPWNEWDSPRDFFYNTTDSGYVRVKILAAGGHYAESLSAERAPDNTPPPTKIGFTAS